MRKLIFILTALLLVTASVVLLLTPKVYGATYTQKQLAFVDEFGDPISHTTLTSVTIQDAGTSTTSTIYSDRIGTSMTNPIVTGLAADQITFWSRDADYKCSATDGTYTRSVDNLTGSDTRFAFPTYLVAMSSRTASDSQTYIWGTDSDVTSQWINATDIFRWTPTADGVSFDIGSTLAATQFDFHVYVGGISGGGLTIDEGTGAFTYVSASGAIAFDATGSGAFGIHTGAATGAITLGSATSGAWAVDGTTTGTLNADDSIDVTTSGAAADITVDAVAGSVIIDGGEAAADAIVIKSTGGGLDLTAIDNIDMVLTAAAGGDDFKITQGGSQDASIHLLSAGTGADAISLITSAGGIDLTVAGAAAGEDIDITSNTAINLTSSEAANSAIVISTSNAAGQIVITSTDTTVDGIDINASGGIDIDTADDFTLDVAGAAGQDILITNTGGSITLSASESATDAVIVTSTAGGIDILASGAAAGEDIDIVATGSSVNITSTEDDDSAITITASGPGKIAVKGGLDLNTYFSEFDTVPCLSLWGAGGASTGTAGDENVMIMPEGNVVYHIIGTQTITGPVLVAAGLDITGDVTENDGWELSFGEPLVGGAKTNFTTNTDAFYIEANITLADADGADDLWVGFRLVEAYQADNEAYNTYAYFGVNAADLTTETELNGGGTTSTDINETNWADAGTHTLGVYVANTGAVTYELDGVAATGAAGFDWSDNDVVVPFLYLRHHTNVSESTILNWVQVGLQ